MVYYNLYNSLFQFEICKFPIFIIGGSVFPDCTLFFHIRYDIRDGPIIDSAVFIFPFGILVTDHLVIIFCQLLFFW